MLPESFDDALALYADAEPGRMFCAFSGDDEPVSWGWLRRSVEDCEAALRAQGVGTGVRVALRLPGSLQLLIHLLAVMRAGGVAVPVAADTQPALLDVMLEVLDPHLVIEPETVGTESPSGFSDPEVRVRQRPGARDDDLSRRARLGIFTSGSTSRPKCVFLSQENLLAGARFVIEAHDLRPDDTAICCMPLSHINGVVTTILAPLLSGGKVVYLQGTFTPRAFLACMAKHRATWFSAAPLHYQLLLYPGENSTRLDHCRFGRSASAPLNPEVQTRFESLYGVPVIQTLGLTECAGQVFSNPMEPGAARTGSVGCPVGNEAGVVDNDGRHVPDETEGEIRVRGPNVMLGYFGDDAATAATLRDGWLYTGDLAYRDRDGFFHVTGRKKLIAIFGGVNVSLVSVEQTALDVSFVSDAAAVSRDCPPFGEVVDLYYTGGGKDPGSETKAIEEALAGVLPSHHALGRVRRLDALPRSESGKLRRYLLGKTPGKSKKAPS